MNREECLKRMKAPADLRNPAFHSIIQIVVTSCCDRACSNCTYLVKYRRPEHITVDNFRRSLDSLFGYPGIVGMIGGNPCLHPRFDELCVIMAEAIPEKNKRGLWTNRLWGHGAISQQTFGFFNLNVHGDKLAAEEMRECLPGVRIFGLDKPSIHGGIMVSLSDLVTSEEERWKLISRCDINQNWSAAIVQIAGEIEGYFCELASSFAAVSGERHGVLIEPGWWGRTMMSRSFAKQVDEYCHRCGVPLRIRGHEDVVEIDDISLAYSEVQKHGRKRRDVVSHDRLPKGTAAELTDYQRLRTGAEQ